MPKRAPGRPRKPPEERFVAVPLMLPPAIARCVEAETAAIARDTRQRPNRSRRIQEILALYYVAIGKL